ncbi:MAG TPA: VWA domain-containing protein [bacterium]|nr:VWA domain-containing protein [bacterium]
MPFISFARPLALLLLPCVVLVLRLGRRRAGRRWRTAALLRAGMVGLLILAFAGPAVRVPATGASVVFVVDRSLSVTATGAGDAEAAFLRAALARMRSGDRAGVITFAGRPALRVPVGPHPAAEDLGVGPEPDATDIGAALDLARGVLPPEGTRRIVLLSDGEENSGDAAAAARAAAAAGVPIDAVPAGGTPASDVLVDDVVAPQEVRPGERYEIRAVLRSTGAASAAVTLRRDGIASAVRQVSLDPGLTAVRFPEIALTPGPIRYTVDIEATPDTVAGNDHGEALVVVRGRPRVLLVSDGPRTLTAWLTRQGLDVEPRLPDALPASPLGLAPYAGVVLDDVPATALSAAQQDALRTFVGSAGGGLAAIGGPHSFGIGGYAGTPLEAVLPLKMDVRQTAALPTVAIVLVIDTSGSMEAFGTELAKEELAKEVAASVIDHLGPHDLIGVITFDQEYRWLVPMTEARFRARILDEVAHIQAGGGTLMYPPLAGARAALRTSPARLRHVIVVSDGLTDPGDFRTLVTDMARDRITVSSVAIGNDADRDFMRNLARWGLGRAYYAKDLYAIPEIFTTEAFLAMRSYLVEAYTPLARGGPAPTLAGLSAPPPIDGYVATVAKPDADVALLSPRHDPVVATWQYGLGRAVAVTSDDGVRWTARWGTWPDVARFWSQTVRWMLRDEGAGLYAATASRGGRGRVALEVRRPDGTPWSGLTVAGDISTPGGGRRGIPLIETAPGRYEGAWPAAVPGTYTAVLAARNGAAVVGTRIAGLVVPYSPELRPAAGGPALLAKVVETTGGALLSNPGDPFRPGSGSGSRDAWPPLVAAALTALVAEVTVRRVPALVDRLAALGGLLVRRRDGAAATREARAGDDAAYDAADRWAADDAAHAEEDALRAASMEHAARLYIARLRAGRRN